MLPITEVFSNIMAVVVTTSIAGAPTNHYEPLPAAIPAIALATTTQEYWPLGRWPNLEFLHTEYQGQTKVTYYFVRAKVRNPSIRRAYLISVSQNKLIIDEMHLYCNARTVHLLRRSVSQRGRASYSEEIQERYNIGHRTTFGMYKVAWRRGC